MSKYDEMCEAANTNRKNWFEFRDRSWKYMGTILNGFQKYCEIPDEQLTLLKWEDAKGKYCAAESGQWVYPGVIEFDAINNLFHLGVWITLTPKGHFPEQWVSFAIFVSERDGKPVVQVGRTGEWQEFDPKDHLQCIELYESMVSKVKQGFLNPRKSNSRQIGFTEGSVVTNGASEDAAESSSQ